LSASTFSTLEGSNLGGCLWIRVDLEEEEEGGTIEDEVVEREDADGDDGEGDVRELERCEEDVGCDEDGGGERGHDKFVEPVDDI
jgi:hypothetical protein